MKTALFAILVSIFLSGCYPPDTALDFAVHPRKKCTNDVTLHNLSSNPVRLVVRTSDKISDTRCESGSDESSADVAAGESVSLQAQLKCVDCYINRTFSVEGGAGALIYGEGPAIVTCDNSGCVKQ